MPGPLDGFRIIDVTQMVSGPMATMILADQGADVIKVEPPTNGDLTRLMGGRKRGMAPTFVIANRNKRSIAIDLKKAEGVALLKRLVAKADLFVQNFRPGAADRMGIGEAALRAVNPSLVYVSISGFGDTGPYIHKRVYDPVIQALSGLTSIQADTATNGRRDDSRHRTGQSHRVDRRPGHDRRLARAYAHRPGPACAPRDARRGRRLHVARIDGRLHLYRQRRHSAPRPAQYARSDLRHRRWLHHRRRQFRR